MAEIISDIEPDLIFNTASVQSFWVVSELPVHISKALWSASADPWTACHAYPALQLMKAIKASGVKTTVVNTALLDAVNPLLKEIALAPDIGIGSVSNICQPIREAVSKIFNSDISSISISVKIVAHYHVGNTIPSAGHAKGAPYYLSVKNNGEEISQDMLPHDKIFKHIKTDLKRGKDGMFVTASSVVRIIESFFGDKR